MYERLKVDDKKNDPDFSKKLNENLNKNIQSRTEKAIEANEEVWEAFAEAKEKIFSFFDEIKIKIDKEKIDSLKIFITEDKNPFFDNEVGSISVTQKNLENKERLIHELVHETLHFLSANKINFEKYTEEFNDIEYNVMSAKVGYNSTYNLVNKNGNTSEYTKNLFIAFNEGITESLTSWIIKDNNKRKRKYGYKEEVEMVEKIKDNIYENEDNKFPREFLQEYFDGGMMHLRKIEKFYGKGSLGLLAELNTEIKIKNIKNGQVLAEKLELRRKILEFFTSDDLNKREELRNILIR